MNQLGMLVSCVFAANTMDAYGWIGFAFGGIAAIVFIFHPRFEIELRPGLNRPYAGMVTSICVIVGLMIGSIVGVLIKGSCQL